MIKDRVFIEIYNRGKGFNFRLVEESNFGKKIIISNRQGYENKKECRRIAGKYLPNISIVEISYYRLS